MSRGTSQGLCPGTATNTVQKQTHPRGPLYGCSPVHSNCASKNYNKSSPEHSVDMLRAAPCPAGGAGDYSPPQGLPQCRDSCWYLPLTLEFLPLG